MTDNKEFDNLRTLHAATTGGEWFHGEGWVFTDPVYEDDKRLSDVTGMKFADPVRRDEEYKRAQANIAFIVAAHNELPALLARLDEVTAEKDALAAFTAEVSRLSEWGERKDRIHADVSILSGRISRLVKLLAPAPSSVLAVHDAKVRAEALREAAELADLRIHPNDENCVVCVIEKRLRTRANEIEEENLMTDNEQEYTPTEEQVERLARAFFAHTKEGRDGFSWPLNGEKDRERDMEEARRILIRVLGPDFLAAQRVTLVADSQEALAQVARWLRQGMPFDAETWGQYDDQAQHAATVVEDALLASGVVQVTTPTETDERDAALAAIRHNWRTQKAPLFHTTTKQILDSLGSRPTPVAPPTEEWEDPEPYIRNDQRFSRERARVMTVLLDYLPRTREQYEADQKPVVPVDALGFPTQVGATFRARFFHKGDERFEFEVTKGIGIRSTSTGTIYNRFIIDPTSIEDVRPADGRGGQ